MTDKKWGFDILQIHAGQTPDSDCGSRALPICQTTFSVFPDAETTAGRFAPTTSRNIYARTTNPMQAVLEEKFVVLEGGAAALLVASGQASGFYTLLNLAQVGDGIIASLSLYGGTYNLLKVTLAQVGIVVRFVENPDDPESWRAFVNNRTRALYSESIPSPKGDILDIKALPEIAHQNGIPSVIDNMIGTSYNVRPLEHGADIVVESTTKFLSGHGTPLGGAIIEKGDFDWTDGKFPLLSEPDESYDGLTFASIGPGAFVTRTRVVLPCDTDAVVSPFNAFLLAQGLKTLSLRMERHLSNAKVVVEFLDRYGGVGSIRHSSLVFSLHYELAQKYTSRGAGSAFTSEIKNGVDAGKRLVEALKPFSDVANVGDVCSLAIHPAPTTYSQMAEGESLAAGITSGTVRLSIGIESIENVLAGPDQVIAVAMA